MEQWWIDSHPLMKAENVLGNTVISPTAGLSSSSTTAGLTSSSHTAGKSSAGGSRGVGS